MASHNLPVEDSPDTLGPVQEDLTFQSFLRKRKDTRKFTWSKYWFKLQNTTLYFYTNKESQETSLRGQYYMYSVQSVRTVSSAFGNFTFEIVMKNGKRKLLSAESANLRDVWVKLLWKSMQLPGPGRHNSSCTWYDIPELIQRVSCSSTDSQPLAVTDDNSLNDDVFEQHPGAVQTDGPAPGAVQTDGPGPGAVQTEGPAPGAVQTDGQPAGAVQTDGQPPGAVQTDGRDGECGPDAAYNPEFLNAVQPLYTDERKECTEDAVEEEQLYLYMSDLVLCDTLTLSTMNTEVSGEALKEFTDGTDVSCPVDVQESPAEASSP